MRKADDSAGDFLIKPNRRAYAGTRMAVVTSPSEWCSALDGERLSARWHQEAGSFIHEINERGKKKNTTTPVHAVTVELKWQRLIH